MKVEFNPDGSIKLPDRIQKANADNENRMKTGRCVLIRKEVVSTYSPKKCVLHITLSDAIIDNKFIDGLYKEFMDRSEVPSKLSKLNDKEFKVEIGTCFRRCSDCNSLVYRFRNYLDGNVIEQDGNCSYNKVERNLGSDDWE